VPALTRRTSRRLCVVAALTLVLALAALTPAQREYRRLLRVPADTGEPLTTAPVDARAIRRARNVIAPGSTYFVYTGGAARNPQLFSDVLGVAVYSLMPSLPVKHAREASWVLSYRAPTLTPPSVRALSRVALGDGVYAVRVRPR
jgi:hypothetical protein